MKTKLIVIISLLCLVVGVGAYQSSVSGGSGTGAGATQVQFANVIGTSDPCQNPGLTKSSQPINITSATTTQIVALSGSTKVYVCGGYLDIGASGTSAASAVFEYGTGASCGTGTTALTGAMGTENTTATNGSLPVTIPGDTTNFATASGNALCILSAGTTVAIHGWITFVQQ